MAPLPQLPANNCNGTGQWNSPFYAKQNSRGREVGSDERAGNQAAQTCLLETSLFRSPRLLTLPRLVNGRWNNISKYHLTQLKSNI